MAGLKSWAGPWPDATKGARPEGADTPLLVRQRRSRRRDAGVAGELVIAAALERGGIAGKSSRVVEKLAFIHSNRRAGDGVDGGGVRVEVIMRKIEGAATAGLSSSSAGISGEVGISDQPENATATKNDTARTSLHVDIVRLDDQRSAAPGRIDTGTDVAEVGVAHIEVTGGRNILGNAGRALVLDMAIVDKDPVATRKIDPAQAGAHGLAGSLDIQGAKDYHGIIYVSSGGNIDVNSIGGRIEDRSKPAAVRAFERHRLCDCYGAETTRIEHTDFTAFGGL